MGVRLDLETRERLKSLGAMRDRSPHYLMREAIFQFLDREESLEREKRITLERWERYRQTGDSIDHHTVSEWIDGLVGEKPKRACPVDGS
jgi:predicted transcriptional regulator